MRHYSLQKKIEVKTSFKLIMNFTQNSEDSRRVQNRGKISFGKILQLQRPHDRQHTIHLSYFCNVFFFFQLQQKKSNGLFSWVNYSTYMYIRVQLFHEFCKPCMYDPLLLFFFRAKINKKNNVLTNIDFIGILLWECTIRHVQT